MLLSVDWSVLDAKLPPYTKQIQCAPRLSEFRYSVDDDAKGVDKKLGLDLEESLLTDGCGDEEYTNSSGRDAGNSGYGNNTYVGGAAPSDISSVSSAGIGSGVSGWTGNKDDIADKLFLMFSSSEHLASSPPLVQTDEGEDEDGAGAACEAAAESPLARMLVAAGVPADLRTDDSLTHLDAEIVIELFTENQSITVFIEEMSKFAVPRIVSSKLYMHLKSIVKTMK